MQLLCPQKHSLYPCISGDERNGQYAEQVIKNGGPFPYFICSLCANNINNNESSLTCGTCEIDICERCFIPFTADPAKIKTMEYTIKLKCLKSHQLITCMSTEERKMQYSEYAQQYGLHGDGFWCNYCSKVFDTNQGTLTCAGCQNDFCGRCAISRYLKNRAEKGQIQ